MKIYIVGSGKLANAILSSEGFRESSQFLKWLPEYVGLKERAVVVHSGSGRELEACMKFCRKTGSVLIELSTGLETERLEPDFPLVVCPNTSILVLRVLYMLKSMGKLFSTYDISIVESHQSAKKSAPGTAYKIAEYLNLPINKIGSIRDPEVQSRELGIEKDFLDKHAYHKITIKDASDEVTIEMKVQGHESYSMGVRKIIDVALTTPLQRKRYNILDLIEEGFL
jgi:4-hydroxy-tetrahydrodipicolinate reductase